MVCRITYAGDRGTVTYPITPKIQLDFERFYGIGLGQLDKGIGSMDGPYHLAWEVQKVHKADCPGGVCPNFDDWLEGLEAIETDTEDVGPFVRATQADG